MSLAEEVLASLLEEEGISFLREQRFHHIRRWRFDFVFPEYHVAAEINGGIWVRGRHNRASQIKKEYEKLNNAAILGWRVLLFTTEDVMESDVAIETIKECLRGYEDNRSVNFIPAKSNTGKSS